LSLSVLDVGEATMELSLNDHFGSLFNFGVLIAFTSLSFDINFNLAVSRNLVDSVHYVLNKRSLVGFNLSFNGQVTLKFDSALGKHANVFSFDFLSERKV
jgi:hypothetical protein